MSDLVGNHEDRFSRNKAHKGKLIQKTKQQLVYLFIISNNVRKDQQICLSNRNSHPTCLAE